MREYRRVPALESGSKLSNPDLQDIGEKNYTDIILRYGNLTTRFPQLNTNAKTIVAAINELYAHPGGTTVIPNPLDNQILTESGESLELEQGGILQTEQGGGGTVVGSLTSISIDGDIYTIEGGGTDVVANPSEDATDLLYSLKVDSTTYSVQGFEITGTLIAGQTTLIFNNAKITTLSTFNVFTDPYGAILNDIIATNGKLILSFEEQQSNVAVKVRIT